MEFICSFEDLNLLVMKIDVMIGVQQFGIHAILKIHGKRNLLLGGTNIFSM
jgi:hypothetical protein